jgi:hypothetical protein
MLAGKHRQRDEAKASKAGVRGPSIPAQRAGDQIPLDLAVAPWGQHNTNIRLLFAVAATITKRHLSSFRSSKLDTWRK